MWRFLIFFLGSFIFSATVHADDKEINQIKTELTRSFPEMAKAVIKPAPVRGLYEVEIDTQIFYVTPDGKYLFMGDMMDLGARSNLTELRRASLRANFLNEVGEDNMIVFGPANAKRTLTVFTDVDCTYCAMFHRDVPTLNKEGVKVRYLFYPRTGIGSESYKRAVAVWCSADRAKAIGVAKSGGKLDMKTCTNPVEQHYHLGERMGVEGTPTIFLDNGKKFPGYLPARELLNRLGLKTDAPATTVH
ncbi:MAG: DsbC family protein [Gammaproteobacteria bacterium]|nr:DsbC family protein [Gammaproteobacteria bacterium]